MSFYSQIYALYRVESVTLPKGFTNKIPMNDLRDAYNYAIQNLKEDIDYDFQEFIADNESVQIPFKFESITLEDPEEVEDISGLASKPRGWLKKIPKEQWVEELKDEYDRDFDHIITLRNTNKLPPAIMLEEEFGDGRARNLMQYALAEKTPVANYIFSGELN